MKDILSGREVFAITRFSSEQRIELEKRGFQIFELRGESVASLKMNGVGFWSNWHNGLEIENERCKASEVAINVDDLFLPGSGGLTLQGQQEMTKKYSQSLSQIIPGVKAIIGTALDYLDLDCGYTSKTNMSFFRRAGSYDNTSTTTIGPGENYLYVGRSFNGLPLVAYRPGKTSNSDVRVLPIIVPANYI